MSGFPCLPLFQLTLPNLVKPEVGYCGEGPLSCMGGAVTYVCFSLLPVKKGFLFSSVIIFAISSPGFFTNFLTSCWPTAYT